ncbi:MAG: hypothetical protein ABSG53_29415, partial [Thermoguttaceae bacterium]
SRHATFITDPPRWRNSTFRQICDRLHRRKLPDVRVSRVDHHEGGILSAKREYLRVRRKELIFDICAAPFGPGGFFVSWWLGELPGCLLAEFPLLGPILTRLFKPMTYYRLDTALMFQESVRAAVLEILDGVTKAKGLRALSELDRKPIMAGLFSRGGLGKG